MNPGFIDLETPQIPENWLDFLIAIRLKDGSIITREIATISEIDDETYRVSWKEGEDTSYSLIDIHYVGLAYYARFSTDALEEFWTNDSVVEVPYSVIKIPEDQSYPL